MVNDDGGIYGRKLSGQRARRPTARKNQQQVQAEPRQRQRVRDVHRHAALHRAPTLADAGQPTFSWNINPEMTGHDNIFANKGALCFECAGHDRSVGCEEARRDQGRHPRLRRRRAVEASAAEGTKTSFEKYPTAEVVFLDDTLGFAAADSRRRSRR